MNDLLPYLSEQLQQALQSLVFFMPEVHLTILFILVLLTDLVNGKNSGWICRILACAGLLFVAMKDLQQLQLLASGQKFLFFGEMLVLHRTAVFFKAVIDVLCFILLMYFPWDKQLKAHRKGLSDLYSIVIAAVLGLHVMVMAVNLLSVYLAVEMVSIASYLLTAYRTENAFSAEGGLKYVLFGAVASAVMLYGISLLYVLTGSLNLYSLSFMQELMAANPLPVAAGLILIFAGIGFKLSFVPMHFWVPDVYQGAATPITAWLSTLPKIAAFALLYNFMKPFPPYPQWTAFNFSNFICVIAIITMLAGNFAAVWQTDIKRILAYSSIGHTGFALMAVAAFTPQGERALLFYLVVYAIANIAALSLASFFSNVMRANDLKSYQGLGLRYPVASVCFVIVLISLTGLPLTAGFNGKLLAFSAVYNRYQQSNQQLLLYVMVTGALTTVVSLFYYIKIPLYLFIKKTDVVFEPMPISLNLVIFSLVIVFLIIWLGIFPQTLSAYL